MAIYPKIFVVGDIHGCAQEFEALIERIHPRPGIDQVWCTGDLVDKGPSSLEAIRTMRRVIQEFPGSGCLMGNHEKSWLLATKRQDPDHQSAAIMGEDLAFLRSLPLFARPAGLFLVHAGVYPGFYRDHGPLVEADAQWSREGKRAKAAERFAHVRVIDVEGDPVGKPESEPQHRRWHEVYDGREGYAVFGHEPTISPIQAPHALGIDTGCVYGGFLTAAVFGTSDTAAVLEAIVQEPARQAYAKHRLWGAGTEFVEEE